MRRQVVMRAIAGSVACLAGAVLAAVPGGTTSFTYQGQLKQSGVPVNDTCDVTGTLWDAATIGSSVAGPQTVPSVEVVNGLFTAVFDFGAGVFIGAAPWLEIAVRCPAGGGNFMTLAPRQPVTAAPYSIQTRGVAVDDAGKVGIGTNVPNAKLHVKGIGNVLDLEGTSHQLYMRFYPDGFDAGPKAEVGWSGATTPDFRIANFITGGDILLTTTGTGNVGIGTAAPAGKLTIAHDNANAIRLERSGLETWSIGLTTNGSDGLAFTDESDGTQPLFLDQTGNVGIGTANPGAKLEVVGTARVQVLEIMGADLAEKFPVTEQVDPGMVVEIDSDHPGKLRLSRGSYNRRVAGVVSGANGLPVGAVLGHLPGNEDAPPIALSGRVWVQCDATQKAIEPGDLLTTSDTPGHAMKATNHIRAQGAIIGKAMTRLDNGNGLVLVLVSLQ